MFVYICIYHEAQHAPDSCKHLLMDHSQKKFKSHPKKKKKRPN